jgi:hypothetical protein
MQRWTHLPDDLRQAITLREMDGLSYEDIAEVMNCPIGTVRSRIFRAREAISAKIKPMLDKADWQALVKRLGRTKMEGSVEMSKPLESDAEMVSLAGGRSAHGRSVQQCDGAANEL